MTTELSKKDKAALELALKLTLADPERVEQIEYKLQHDGWQSTAEFCAYHRQRTVLKLAPWQEPPIRINGGELDTILANQMLRGGRYEAACLLKQMLDLGISSYHPDPLAAIEEAKRT